MRLGCKAETASSKTASTWVLFNLFQKYGRLSQDPCPFSFCRDVMLPSLMLAWLPRASTKRTSLDRLRLSDDGTSHTGADGQEPFSYSPLDVSRREIRVLVVHPGEFGEPIRGSIRHVSLRSEPRYETISYCWGSKKKRTLIRLNEGSVSVPASSAAALRRVRSTDQPRMVWIDAICINQRDDDERGQQVSMMAEIYRSSTHNLIYLGEGDASTKLALECLDRIIEEIREDTDDFTAVIGTCLDPNQWTYTHSGLRCEVNFDALQSFYKLPWFR